MGWLLADIATTLIVALAYWTIAVLRDAARSLALAGRRARSGGALQMRSLQRGMLNAGGMTPERFATAEPHCVQPPPSQG